MWTIPSKYVHINMCPIFSVCVCGDTAVWMLRIKSLTKGMKERQMTY